MTSLATTVSIEIADLQNEKSFTVQSLHTNDEQAENEK